MIIEGKDIDIAKINFVNVEYVDDVNMKIEIHLSDGTIYRCNSQNHEMVSELDKFTDLCSIK